MDSPESAASPPARGEVLAVGLVLGAALLLRFVNLADAPPGLFRDELEKGYTALELWRTGRHGFLGDAGVAVSAPMPLFIEVFAGHDRTSAIYQYFSAPFVGLFGLTAFTTRLAAGLAGFGSVALAWLLARHRWGVGAGLLACAAMAFHPAGILFSRWAQQGIFVLFWTLLGFLLLSLSESRRGTHNERALGGCGGLSLGLAAYSYDPARLVVPLLLGAWVLTREGPLAARLRQHGWALAAFAILWLPLAWFTVGPGAGRLGRVAVQADGPVDAAVRIVGQYASHFSPWFWVVGGDANARHRLPVNGFAGLGMTVLMLGGVSLVVCRLSRGEGASARDGLFLVAWLLAAPLAAALTRDTPHALRANLLIPVPALLAAWAWKAADLTCGLRALGRLGLFVALAVDAGRSGLGVARLGSVPGGPWEAGVQEAMTMALARPGRVYLSGDIPYASYVALFAERTDPEKYQELGLAALRTQILPPGSPVPTMTPGDTFVGPPGAGQPLEFFSETAIVYCREVEGTVPRLPVR